MKWQLRDKQGVEDLSAIINAKKAKSSPDEKVLDPDAEPDFKIPWLVVVKRSGSFSGFSEYFFHLSSFRQFVHELVKHPHFLRQWVFNFLNAVSACYTRN